MNDTSVYVTARIPYSKSA